MGGQPVNTMTPMKAFEQTTSRGDRDWREQAAQSIPGDTTGGPMP